MWRVGVCTYEKTLVDDPVCKKWIYFQSWKNVGICCRFREWNAIKMCTENFVLYLNPPRHNASQNCTKTSLGKNTHALIRKRFLFIRQHATQQQAQTILRIIAESKAPEGNECDTERTSSVKKSSQNVDTDDDSEKSSARSFHSQWWFEAKSVESIKLYENLFSPPPLGLTLSLVLPCSQQAYYHTHHISNWIKKKNPRKPKYVES